jgi:hypothetical protein
MIRDKEFDRRIGRVVKLLGKAGGVPMTRLALDIGLSYTALNARLAGETQFSALEVSAIADYFEVPVEVLYGDPVDRLLELMRDRQAPTKANARPSPVKMNLERPMSEALSGVARAA